MTQEALKLALEALEYTTNLSKFLLKNEANIGPMLKADEAITAIKEALAQHDSVQAKPEPEQEPKCGAIIEVFGKDWRLEYMSLPVGKHKLYTQQYTYTTPPQREPKPFFTEANGFPQGFVPKDRHKVEQEPMAMKFKIYKPTVPDPTRQDINNALLPWVYDQDRSSGFDASMWVTPVSTLPPQRTWVGLTDEEINTAASVQSWKPFAKAIEAKLKQKNGFAEEKNT